MTIRGTLISGSQRSASPIVVAGLPADHVEKVVRGNAIRLLQLDLGS
jgi:hypothetical protein